MNVYSLYTKPQVLGTLKSVLAENNQPTEGDDYFESWLLQKLPDDTDRSALVRYLKKLDAIDFQHYCGDWIKEFSLGYDLYQEVGKDDSGQPVYENSIILTTLGKQFISSLFENHVKPYL